MLEVNNVKTKNKPSCCLVGLRVEVKTEGHGGGGVKRLWLLGAFLFNSRSVGSLAPESPHSTRQFHHSMPTDIVSTLLPLQSKV